MGCEGEQRWVHWTPPPTESQDFPATVMHPPPSTGGFSLKLMELKLLYGTLQDQVPRFVLLILCCFYKEGPPHDMFHVKMAAAECQTRHRALLRPWGLVCMSRWHAQKPALTPCPAKPCICPFLQLSREMSIVSKAPPVPLSVFLHPSESGLSSSQLAGLRLLPGAGLGLLHLIFP